MIKIIDNISNRLAHKFRFGYHEIDDMKQQIFLEVLKPDQAGKNILEKFDPARGSSLDSILWIHIRNRLHNFKRDNFIRPEKPCDNCPIKAYVNNECTAFSNLLECDPYFTWFTKNQSKKSLINDTFSQKDIHDHRASSIDDIFFSKEIYNIVNNNIPVSIREDWIRFTNKLKIPKNKREKLIQEILIILKENGIEP